MAARLERNFQSRSWEEAVLSLRMNRSWDSKTGRVL
jgi:hypothetical protein